MTVTGYPGEPPGLVLLQLSAGTVALAFDPDHVDPPGSPWADARRTWGWYYGYPACCVDAFVDRDDRRRDDPAERERWAALIETVSDAVERGDRESADRCAARWAHEATNVLPWHPVSGHLLCPACAAGPKAPLPPRPANDYGFLAVGGDGEPILYEPSGYHGFELVESQLATRASDVEQLAFDLGPAA